MTEYDTALIHALDCALTAFEISVALAEADFARREAKAYERWHSHQDRLRVSAGDWAVFEARRYAGLMGPRQEAVRA